MSTAFREWLRGRLFSSRRACGVESHSGFSQREKAAHYLWLGVGLVGRLPKAPQFRISRSSNSVPEVVRRFEVGVPNLSPALPCQICPAYVPIVRPSRGS